MENGKKDQTLRSFRIVAQEDLKPYVHLLLTTEGYEYEQEPFSADCFRLLVEPKPLGSSWAAFFGYIYIQDRSSMLPPLALNPKPASMVLDMCASPGSKTSFLAQLVGLSGFVLANEAQNSRLLTLRRNLEHLNLLQTVTSTYKGQDLKIPPASFNYIALDPPCSGWGTAEKNPQVLKLWRETKVDRLINLQRQLLIKACSLLAENGLLLYSTCTTNSLENEEQVIFATQNLNLEIIPLPKIPGFVFDETEKAPGTLTVNSKLSKAQGFYLALLRQTKKIESHLTQDSSSQLTKSTFTGQNFNLKMENLTHPSLDFSKLPSGQMRLVKNDVFFYPEQTRHLPHNFKFYPFKIGSMHGGRFSPAPRLRILARKPDSQYDLILDDLKDLSKIISGQSLTTTFKDQSTLLWWQNLPLGFVQIKHGRILAQFR